MLRGLKNLRLEFLRSKIGVACIVFAEKWRDEGLKRSKFATLFSTYFCLGFGALMQTQTNKETTKRQKKGKIHNR
jgi:hypothetical protein